MNDVYVVAGAAGPELGALNWAAAQVTNDLYPGLCLTFVFQTYIQAGIPDAQLRGQVSVPIGPNTYPVDIWGHINGTIGTSQPPPVGAIVFWSAKNGDRTLSHAALSTGDGRTVSTADSLGSKIHYEDINAHNAYANYLGWWLPA
jgi:cell wall-associated NlpC family hydrolase